jgi:hypothetical protein
MVEIRISGPHGERVLRERAATLGWYPPRALELGKNGVAVIRCNTLRDQPYRCTSLYQDPNFPDSPGLNFGAAAVKGAEAFGAAGGEGELFFRFTIIGGGCAVNRTVY